MNVYAFDVDETLECSRGPVKLFILKELRKQGHIVGICGNKYKFVQAVPKWYEYVSFMNVNYNFKHVFLETLKDIIKGADEYIFVGNKNPSNTPYSDSVEAYQAGWTFIEAVEFMLK